MLPRTDSVGSNDSFTTVGPTPDTALAQTLGAGLRGALHRKLTEGPHYYEEQQQPHAYGEQYAYGESYEYGEQPYEAYDEQQVLSLADLPTDARLRGTASGAPEVPRRASAVPLVLLQD